MKAAGRVVSRLGACPGQNLPCLSPGPGAQVIGPQPGAVSGCSLLTGVQRRPTVSLSLLLGRGPLSWGQGCVAGAFPGTSASSAALRAGFGQYRDGWLPSGCWGGAGKGRWPGKSPAPARGHKAGGGWQAWLKEAAWWEAA